MNPTPLPILPLSECDDITLTGGKAVNLARMIAAGLPVPDGFVVTTAALRHADAGIGSELAAGIGDAYAAIGRPTVAVRSSATLEDQPTASLAGQFVSQIGVRGEEGLLDAVAKCRASVQSERTAAYAAAQHLDAGAIEMAVIVQELVPTEVSGVLFTRNPQSGAADEMLVEAVWGLGNPLVSGAVQPDQWQLDGASGSVRRTRIADQEIWQPPDASEAVPLPEDRRRTACLDEDALRALWELGRRTIECFGCDQDIEWGFAEGRFFLLQSRPVTTVAGDPADLDVIRQSLQQRMDAGHGPWVLHNLAETLPHPTPLTWSVFRRLLSGDEGLGLMYRSIGFAPAASCRDGFIDLIAGRPYADLARLPEMFFAGLPFRYDVARARIEPETVNAPPALPAGSFVARFCTARRFARVNANLRARLDLHDSGLADTVFPEFSAWCGAEKGRDLPRLSAAEWCELWQQRSDRILNGLAPQSMVATLLLKLAMDDLAEILGEYCWQEDTQALLQTLATGVAPSLTVRAGIELHEVGCGRLSIEQWLTEFGHRGPNELELAAPRWREIPGQVAAAARQAAVTESPLARHQRRCAQAAAAAARTRATLSARGQAEFDRCWSLVRRYVNLREDGRHCLVLGLDLLRDLALEARNRLALGDDVFLLEDSELAAAVTAGAAPAAVVAARRCRRKSEASIPLPEVIEAADVRHLGEPAATPPGQRRRAMPIAPGTACGPVCLAATAATADVEPGCILVCSNLDPAWTVLFPSVAGVVVERGGALSHSAIVARELGLPVVVMPDAVRTLRPGATVILDGCEGWVSEADTEAVVEPWATDIVLPAGLTPPPAGRCERRGRRLVLMGFTAWGLFLAAAWLLPATWLRLPVSRFLDGLLWPVVGAVGKPGTVALLGAGLAVLIIGLQAWLTDSARLRQAAGVAGHLRGEAAAVPRGSTRRRCIGAVLNAIQVRLALAALLPLALLLGPLVLLFLWLPARVAPAVESPPPGATVNVYAVIDGEPPVTVTLAVDPPLRLDEACPGTQATAPVRSVLTTLYDQWRGEETPSAPLPGVPLATPENLENLELFLARPLPSQRLAWQVLSPTTADGRFPIRVTTGEQELLLGIVLGERSPPGRVRVETQTGPLRALHLEYPAPSRPPVFWRPLQAFGIDWDCGWLGVYLLAYLPVMLALRWALKLP